MWWRNKDYKVPKKKIVKDGKSFKWGLKKESLSDNRCLRELEGNRFLQNERESKDLQ